MYLIIDILHQKDIFYRVVFLLHERDENTKTATLPPLFLSI